MDDRTAAQKGRMGYSPCCKPVPEGRQNCSPGRKPWVTNPTTASPGGAAETSRMGDFFRPSGAFRCEDIYPGLAPWATMLSPLRRLSRRMPASKILYHVRAVEALSIGKNRKPLG